MTAQTALQQQCEMEDLISFMHPITFKRFIAACDLAITLALVLVPVVAKSILPSFHLTRTTCSFSRMTSSRKENLLGPCSPVSLEILIHLREHYSARHDPNCFYSSLNSRPRASTLSNFREKYNLGIYVTGDCTGHLLKQSLLLAFNKSSIL